MTHTKWLLSYYWCGTDSESKKETDKERRGELTTCWTILVADVATRSRWKQDGISSGWDYIFLNLWCECSPEIWRISRASDLAASIVGINWKVNLAFLALRVATAISIIHCRAISVPLLLSLVQLVVLSQCRKTHFGAGVSWGVAG